MFILYIDSLHHSVSNFILKIFADDVTKAVSNVSDCQLLQEDFAQVYDWTVTWQVQLNSGKCEALNLSNKRSPIQFTYTIGGGPGSISESIYINSKLIWSDHSKVIASRASKILNLLQQTMFGCSAHAKDVAYKSIVSPCLESASLFSTGIDGLSSGGSFSFSNDSFISCPTLSNFCTSKPFDA